METSDAPQWRASYILVATFLILAAGIVGAGYLYYWNYEARYRAAVERQLSAIAHLKMRELAQWRKEQLGNAAFFLKNIPFSSLVRRYFEKPDDADTQLQIQSWINSFLQSNKQFDRVRLIDDQGVTRLSVPSGLPPISPVLSRRVPEVLRTRQVVFQDFYRNEDDRKAYLACMVPILDGTDGGRPLGIIVLRIDPVVFLYPFMQHWPVPSRTAETLLCRRDGDHVLFLNELRFQKNTALNLRISLERGDLPFVKAAWGQEGIVEGRDYRGVPMLAAVRTVPGSSWILVARMDIAEVRAPLRESLWIITSLVGALLVGAGAVVALVWRQQGVRSYKAWCKAARALGESESRFRQLAESLPHLVWTCRPDGFCDYLSPQWVEFTGMPEAQQLGSGWLDQVHPDDRSALMTAWNRSVATGEPFEIEFRIRHRSGDYHWFDTRATALRDVAGRIVKWSGMNMDITERKRAGEALRESEEKYRALFESSRDALMTLDPPSWAFTSCNQSTVDMFRAKNAEEFISYGPWELSPERQPDGRASAEKARDMIETAMREGSHFFEWTHKRIDGEGFPATVLLTKM